MNGTDRFLLILSFFLFFEFHASAQERSLDYFFQQGFNNSPVLKDLANQSKETTTDSLLARAGFIPQVSFNGYMMYAPIINGYGYAEPITNGQNLTGTLNVSQDIFNKKTRETEYEKFGLRNQSIRNTGRILKSELEKAITAQYLAACSAYLEGSFQREMLRTLKEEEQILRQLVEAGSYRQTDYLSFRLEVSMLENQLKDSETQFRKELTTLNILCGISDTSTCDLHLPELEVVPLPSPVNSPLFLRFKLDSLQIRNERASIDMKYKPVISWFSDAGLINNQPKIIYQNFGISLGLSLSLPVYDGNQRKLNYRKLDLSEETRKSYEGYFRLQYDLQIRQLKEELDRTRQIVRDNEEQINLAESLVAQDKILLNTGSVPVTDYVMALKGLLETKHTLTVNRIRELQIINELNFWLR
jgi:outer membrane protein TolC